MGCGISKDGHISICRYASHSESMEEDHDSIPNMESEGDLGATQHGNYRVHVLPRSREEAECEAEITAAEPHPGGGGGAGAGAGGGGQGIYVPPVTKASQNP